MMLRPTRMLGRQCAQWTPNPHLGPQLLSLRRLVSTYSNRSTASGLRAAACNPGSAAVPASTGAPSCEVFARAGCMRQPMAHEWLARPAKTAPTYVCMHARRRPSGNLGISTDTMRPLATTPPLLRHFAHLRNRHRGQVAHAHLLEHLHRVLVHLHAPKRSQSCIPPKIASQNRDFPPQRLCVVAVLAARRQKEAPDASLHSIADANWQLAGQGVRY